MKAEEFSDAIGMLDEDLIAEAEQTRKKHKSKRRLWIRCVAAVACLCVVLACVFGKSGMGGNAYALAEAEYPEMAPRPDAKEYVDKTSGAFDMEAFSNDHDAWARSQQNQREQYAGYADGLEGFFSATMQQFLSGAETENRVYSPLNVYLALSMLAEITDGNSRQQILNLLGETEIESLRDRVSALWNANYCKDGAVTSVLANSLWLNETVSFKQSTLNRLAKTYYTSSYRGEMGSAEFTKALQDWLNEQTGGLLQEQGSGIELKKETVLALVSTICFQDRWCDEFQKSETTSDTFHAVNGDVTCEFMHQSMRRAYYWSEQFSAVAQDLGDIDSRCMWLILPDEGVSVDDLLADSAVLDMISAGYSWKNSSITLVNLALPKFDVSSETDLIGGLQSLGVTDVFDQTVSDFSPLARDTDGVFLNEAKHTARVIIDEEGCTAAAYSVMTAYGAEMPPDEVDFVLDRPFLFVITGVDGLPLFAGVVNQPV